MNDPVIKMKLSEVMERWHTAMDDIEECPDVFEDLDTIASHILATIFIEYEDDIMQYEFRRMIEDDINDRLN